MANNNQNLVNERNTALGYFRSGQLDKAKTHFQRVVQANPADWVVWNMLGAVNGMLGDFAASEACCRKAIKMQPGEITTYNSLGNALKNLGKRVEAEQAYRKALKIQPNYAEACSNLGDLLREKGDIEEAERLLRRSIKLKPLNAAAYNNLGTLLLKRGELQGALSCYQKSLSLNPTLHEALFNMACGYISLGRLVEAEGCLRKFLIVQPGNCEAWVTLCRVLGQMCRYKEALTCGHKAVELSDNNPNAHYTLATIYHAIDDLEDARLEYKKAMSINPDLPGAAYFCAILEGDVPERSPSGYIRELFDNYAHNFDDDLVKNLEYKTPVHLNRIIREKVSLETERRLKILDLGCGTGLMGPLLRDIANVLVGVDLSPKMIEMAKRRGIYDKLIVDDVLVPLRDAVSFYDLVIAADVFVYIGRLEDVFLATKKALAPGGYFAFSTEHEESSDGYMLRKSGRYAHSDNYINQISSEYGFDVIHSEAADLRKEHGDPVKGILYILQSL